MSRLKEQYDNEIAAAMTKKFEYKNPMEVPKLVKIVVNMGLRKMHHSVTLPDNDATRGQIREISYLVKVEEA